MKEAWKSWKRVAPHIIAVCAIAIIFFIYIHLSIYGEFRCYESIVPIRITETVLVFMVLLLFLKRLVKSFRGQYPPDS